MTRSLLLSFVLSFADATQLMPFSSLLDVSLHSLLSSFNNIINNIYIALIHCCSKRFTTIKIHSLVRAKYYICILPCASSLNILFTTLTPPKDTSSLRQFRSRATGDSFNFSGHLHIYSLAKLQK